MASNYKTKIFALGLGGTGKDVLVELKNKLRRIGIEDTTKESNVKLLAIDFDEFERSITIRDNSHSKVISLANEEKCYLETTPVKKRMRHMFDTEENKKFYESWFPQPKTAKVTYGMQLAGAAQWRPLGRVGLFVWSERIFSTIREKFYELVEYDVDNEDKYKDENIVIYIATSLAGGTGSGIFLDIAYFLRQLAPNSSIYGLALLANVFRRFDAEKGRIYANIRRIKRNKRTYNFK